MQKSGYLHSHITVTIKITKWPSFKPSHDSYYRKGGGVGVGHSTVVKPAVLNSAPHIPICGFCASASKGNGIRPPLD